MKPKRRQTRGERLAALRRIDRDRIKAGVCRHCAGPVPCSSPFGDERVGVRREPSREIHALVVAALGGSEPDE